jgi:SAM-dependent methyltransferase
VDDSFASSTASSYDKVAAAYADKFQHELKAKPFDRKMLALLVEKTGGRGPLCDLGCGPGQVAAYLHQLGTDVIGIDLSPEMVRQAGKLYPEIPFRAGNMLTLDGIEDRAFAGIAAFYSIIHIPREQVVTALEAMRRVLQNQGKLLLTFHIGDEVRHLETWFEKPVALDFIFFEVQEMKGYLQSAGFILEEVITREAYPSEVQTRRAYLFAAKAEDKR